ncbi:intramembrane metalloprotease PrsW [Paenibacillus sp. IB182496]|uniref:Protease PrsW n=1 Tax=Paenibacillus sabuli TaxID=2772509 RepID=A0A927GRZ5_9BACL|nr:glutamic-type intramembrane protease PrsW [Paenibacillus sabuli]MBD2845192.1 intramembrane metalloprotease PrsW [Paenibacillus sabuli]
MLLLSLFTAAVAPGVSLLSYLYLKDRYDSEPFHMVLRMFVLGMVVVIPILVVQRGLMLWLGESPFVFSYIISSAVEEGFKWFVLYHIIFNHTEFDEPYDGILYAAAISLGFATLENVMYAFLQPVSFGSLLMRALLPVSGHALFGIVMGYYFGKAKFTRNKSRRRMYIWMSLALPLGWHGTYDWIMLEFESIWLWIMIPFMVLLWIRGMQKIQRASARSPFRLVREEEVKM